MRHSVPEPTAPAVARMDLAAFGRATLGVDDLGPLDDPIRREGCLRAVAPTGVRPDDRVLGGRQVVLDGRPGVLLVLATGVLGRFRLVVVDPACGPDGGALMAEVVVGS